MNTVCAALARNRADFPVAPAFCQGQDRLDWAGLAGRVYAGARALSDAPRVIAVTLPNGIDYVIVDLAVTLAGKRLVPIPHFFSAEQIGYILRDAGVQAVIGRDLGLPVLTLPTSPAAPVSYAGKAERVIYTSGSSGTPKGVVLGDRQIGASLAGWRADCADGRGV
ncbi:MAG: AMP-binding protein [Pseudorhodobacter sp.]|nr:AMP-binding protein [Pseudorhodobacter sp.]